MEQELNDYDRGEFDCTAGYPAEDGQSEAYYIAYATRYCYEQTVGDEE